MTLKPVKDWTAHYEPGVIRDQAVRVGIDEIDLRTVDAVVPDQVFDHSA